MMKMKSCLVFSLAMAASLFSPTSWSQEKKDKSCMVYAYMDESGQIVKTTDKKSIPARFRSSLISTRDCDQAESIKSSGGVMTRPAPSLGHDENALSSASPPPSVSFSKGSADSVSRKIFAWFSFTDRWKIILLLWFAAAILAGTIGIITTAFRSSALWGLACILPPLEPVYLLLHWGEVWPSALVWLMGMIGGSIMVFFVLSLV